MGSFDAYRARARKWTNGHGHENGQMDSGKA